jgi:hypothetical protein
MSGGLRFRSEAQLVSSLGTPYAAGTISIVPASKVVGIQRVGVYRCIMVCTTAAGTFQFQDTAGNPLSALYSLLAGGSFFADTPINGDPWWQTGSSINFAANLPLGVGLQLVVTGGPWDSDIWVAMGA